MKIGNIKNFNYFLKMPDIELTMKFLHNKVLKCKKKLTLVETSATKFLTFGSTKGILSRGVPSMTI